MVLGVSASTCHGESGHPRKGREAASRVQTMICPDTLGRR